MKHFWGGVHKQFVLQGPGEYWLRVAKNDSFNTILSSVLIDQIAGQPHRYDHLLPGYTGGKLYEPPKLPRGMQSARLQEATELFTAIKNLADTGPDNRKPSRRVVDEMMGYSKPCHGMLLWIPEVRMALLHALRAAAVEDGSQPLQANCRWHLRYWLPEDRLRHDEVLKTMWESHCVLNGRTKQK